MVGWLGAVALAGIRGLVSQRRRWEQVPYLGAIAAVAVFVQWRFSHRQNGNEVEKEPDGGSKDDAVVVNEKLDCPVESVDKDEGPEFRTSKITERRLDPEELPDCGIYLEEKRNMGVPNSLVPVNQTVLHLLDVPHDVAGTKTTGHVNGLNFRDVTEDPLFSVSDSFKRERPPIETWVLSVEAKGRAGSVIPFREPSNPFHDVGGNLGSDQIVVQDVKNLPQFPKSLLFSTVIVPHVDKNVDAISESHSDANEVVSGQFSFLSVETCKPDWVFQANLPIMEEQKVTEETTKSVPIAAEGKNFEDVISMPIMVEQNVAEETIKSIPNADKGKKFEDVKVMPITVEQKVAEETMKSFPNGDEGKNFEDVIHTPIMEDQKVAKETIKSLPNGDEGKPFEDRINMPQQEGHLTDENGDCHAPRCASAILQVDQTDSGFSLGNSGSEDWKPLVGDISTPQASEQGEHFLQTASPVKAIIVESKAVGNELTNSARREYAERLRSYDEYLADPELSPTLRSQVLRARASVAMYFDDSDDDQ
ncbi:unnamed protein product [Calypogeia fissa]